MKPRTYAQRCGEDTVHLLAPGSSRKTRCGLLPERGAWGIYELLPLHEYRRLCLECRSDKDKVVRVELPIRTRNPLNGQMGNSRMAAILRTKERASHRAVTRLRVLAEMREIGVSATDLVPCVVSLTRVSAGKMDTDGLAASQKGIRDGIADALGVNDGGRFVEWVYSQKKGPQKKHAVVVVIIPVGRK